ncbi:MAG: hypothetical protein QGH42_01950 [Kiritimatiellia bacterium]|nr:hypothetical protein [Kiritimatiellia bacterium]MDP6809260.1 hypothetical protein [Kiritimatiellia bacterium]MDP7022999.1 hypothetical protein [Kiritimatiellia bacterium]
MFKILLLSLTLPLFINSHSRAEGSEAIQLGPDYKPCGELTKFWRGKPVIGRWMGQGFLADAPTFYNQSSFPYKKRGHKQEVKMADFLSTPRLLGGWHPDKGGKGELEKHKHVADADLVYRKKDGSLGYRWELLDLRLSRFINAGYTDLTLVLDQIPYCLARKHHLETYGQAIPPDDLKEWYVFIRDLCKELKRRYSTKTASGFRFRLGTELGSGERIALTQEQLHEMYALTHKAIKEVLPDAKLGPWNEAGFKDKQERAPLKVLALAKYAKANKLAFDFASVSSYSIPKVRGSRILATNPQQKAEGDAKYFTLLREVFPGIPAEYHEFGILNSQYGVVTSEPGSRGGAYRAHYLLAALENRSLDRLYHWSVFDFIGTDRKLGPIQLLRSNGWLYSILEHAAEGKLYVLKGNTAAGNTLYKSALITCPKRSFLIVSAYTLDRRKQGKPTITITLPQSIVQNKPPGKGVVEYVALTPETDIYRTVKADLAKASNLNPEFAKHPDLVAPVKSMATKFAGARKMITANYSAYQNQMEKSLTLKPFGPKMKTDEMTLSLTFPFPTDSVVVFVW